VIGTKNSVRCGPLTSGYGTTKRRKQRIEDEHFQTSNPLKYWIV
jgi:hypothetical protein